MAEAEVVKEVGNHRNRKNGEVLVENVVDAVEVEIVAVAAAVEDPEEEEVAAPVAAAKIVIEKENVRKTGNDLDREIVKREVDRGTDPEEIETEAKTKNRRNPKNPSQLK